MRKKLFTVCCFMLCVNTSFSQECIHLNVASFNLRQDNSGDGENVWANRKEMVKGLICFHELDILGVQEAFKHMLEGVCELNEYAYTGVGRDDGKDAGEHSAILYKTSRFELLQQGEFWFSETPESPSKGWDATCCNRLCSWGKFKDKQSEKRFFFFNVHYDHQGKKARLESSKLLISKIKEITKGASFFCTGDFNAIPESEPMQILYNDKNMYDAYQISAQPPYGPVGTFQGFKIQTSEKGRIDYIFVSKDIEVLKYGVLTDMNDNRFPSDHFPVMIKATL